jgi:hypothetical protein
MHVVRMELYSRVLYTSRCSHENKLQCLLEYFMPSILLLLWYHSLLAPRPTPNLEDQVSNLYPLEIGWPSCTPGHWVARVPRDRCFLYPLTWAPEGAFHTSFSNCVLSSILYRSGVLNLFQICGHSPLINFWAPSYK